MWFSSNLLDCVPGEPRLCYKIQGHLSSACIPNIIRPVSLSDFILYIGTAITRLLAAIKSVDSGQNKAWCLAFAFQH